MVRQPRGHLHFDYSNVGYNGNAWGDEETGIDGFSRIVDTKNCPHVAFMVAVSDLTVVSCWLSQDGMDWYYSEDISDELTPEEPPDYPDWSDDSVEYYEGDIVSHSDDDWVCIKDHKSNSNREPGTTGGGIYWEEYEIVDDPEVDYPQFVALTTTLPARFVRLQSSNDVTATASIIAKA